MAFEVLGRLVLVTALGVGSMLHAGRRHLVPAVSVLAVSASAQAGFGYRCEDELICSSNCVGGA